MKIRQVIILSLWLLIIHSCSMNTGSKQSPVELVNWVENPINGLQVSKEVAGFKYRLQYKPLPYLAVKELKSLQVAQTDIDKRVKAMQDMQYFTLQLGTTEGKDILKTNIEESGDYSKNIEYLSFDIQKDLKLVEQGDTLPCLIHHFERSYGITPFANIVLAFKNITESVADKTLVFDDQHFGGGIIKLTVKGNDLKNLPKLKTIY